MTLVKADISRDIYNQCGFSRTKSMKVTRLVFEMMKTRLESGEDVLISGFGKFCVKDKRERRGRNPATGMDMDLGARRVVIFKCSPVLKKKIDPQ